MTIKFKDKLLKPTSVNLHPKHLEIMKDLVLKGYATNRSELIRAALLDYFVKHGIIIWEE